MTFTGLRRVLVFALLLIALGADAPASPTVTTAPAVPVMTSATVDFTAGTLTILGRYFISQPLPRVHIGSEIGGYIELQVQSATASVIVARLVGTTPGTYRVVVQFGQLGLVVGSMDVTIGAVGPAGDKGDKGDKGDTGAPGAAADLGLTDARYPKLFGNNTYAGNQTVLGSVGVVGAASVTGSVSAAQFIGDGSHLTNVGVARVGDACVLDLTPTEPNDSDPREDAVGVIIGFDAQGKAQCRALAGTECKVLVGDNRRTLRGKELQRQHGPDRIPTDASNCSVPGSGSVEVEGPRPNLSGARLKNVVVAAVGDWSYGDLSRADIHLAGGAILVGANLRGATIQTNGDHDLRFADATGAVFNGSLTARMIADDAILLNAELPLHEAPGSSFKRANLRMTNFSPRGGQPLVGASFVEADLFRANLAGVDCRPFGLAAAGCDFTRAKLRETNLSHMNCVGGGTGSLACDFTQADLTGANLSLATINSAVLDRVIWSNTTCPDGTNSDLADGDGATCLFNLQNGSAGPPGDPSSFLGTFTVTPPIAFTCAAGLVNINVGSLVLSQAGPTTLRATASGLPVALIGSVSGNDFSVQGVVPGQLTETYSLTATFQDGDSWSGTFRARYAGSSLPGASSCTNQSFAVTGVRQ